jgi:hypothetical protein
MKCQTSDAKRYYVNPNCFEKTKVRWGIFKNFPSPIFNRRTDVAHIRHNLFI